MIFGLEAYAAPVMLGILAVLFVAFILEPYPTEVLAIAAAGLTLALGVIDTRDLLGVLSSPAPVTIAALFVLGGALVRTGLLEAAGALTMRAARRRPTATLVAVMAGAMALSAFVNNTPVVIVLIPIVIQFAGAIGQPPSRLLIPLSYAAILGGTCTLIGTSTNILVDGLARDHGLAPFTLFEISGVGVIVALVGGGFMALTARYLLPERTSLASLLSAPARPRFLVEVIVPEGSPLIGRAPREVDAFKRGDGSVIDVLRGPESLRRSLDTVRLQAGDRVMLKTSVAEVMGLRGEREVAVGHSDFATLTTREVMVFEALVGPQSAFAGRQIGALKLRRGFGVYPLAVHRQGENLGPQIDEVVLEPGDTLLMEGRPEDVRTLAAQSGLVNLGEPSERPFRRSKAPIAVATLAAIVGLAAFGVMPIAGLAIIGVAVVLLTRTIEAQDMFAAVEWRIISLILAMLVVGRAMDRSGAVTLVVDAVVDVVRGLPPQAVLGAIYLTTWLLTEAVTNNAVAVVMTPLVIGLAQALGLDPRPFVVAVMVAASASFATPIGYQTNTLVYGPGGYRFTDFFRLGVPMSLVVGAVAVFAIPRFWPLQGQP